MTDFDPNLARHFAYLRRFSRSLTGSRSAGDTLVSDVLSELLEDPTLIQDHLNPRLALYQLYLCFYRDRTFGRHQGRSAAAALTPAAHVSVHCETSRIAMLLTAIEGFSQHEVCEILNMDELAMATMLSFVTSELSVKTGQRICIIEDEPMIALQLHDLMSKMGYRVCSVSRTQEQALADLTKQKPDLILSDVKLAQGGSGFKAVQDFVADHATPVVFVTAFPETLLTGNGVEPAFLISKPFQATMLQAAVNQALYFKSQAFITEAA